MCYKLSLIAVITCLASTGCDQISSVIGNKSSSVVQNASNIEIEFEANLTSPDNALKSWWRYIDAKHEADNNFCVDVRQKRVIKDTFGKVATGEIQEAFVSNKVKCRKNTYSREILEVKVETETRAVAFAKITNSTPSLVSPTKDEEKRRAEGEKYKYLIEKVGSEWRVAQVYQYKSYNNVWAPQYEVIKDFYPTYVFEYQ